MTGRDDNKFETSVDQDTSISSALLDSFTKAWNDFASVGVEGATLIVDGVKI